MKASGPAIALGRLVLGLIALAGAGCAGPTPMPSPTLLPSAGLSSPAPTPTASGGNDLAATERALLANLSDPELSARIHITATETLDYVIQLEGEGYLHGPDYLMRLQMVQTIPSGPVLGELRVGDHVFRRHFSNNKWTSTPLEDAATPRLFAVLAALDDLEPIPPAAANTDLVSFRAPADTDLSLVTLFHQDSVKNNPDEGEVVIAARRDGTPVQVAVTLHSDDLTYGEPGTGIRDYEFTFDYEIVDAVRLPDPDPATRSAVTRYGLSLEYPTGWPVPQTFDGYEAVVGDAEIRIFEPQPLPPAAPENPKERLEGWTAYVARTYGYGEPLSFEELTVDGRDARLVAFDAPAGEPPFFHLEATFIADDRMWEVAWHDLGESGSLAQRFDFERILASIRLDSP